MFRTQPLIQGGLVWEWSNHGLLTEDNGTEYYGYGGDFGDYPNDDAFLMDGLTLSDHSSTPGLVEYTKIIQPVEVKWSNDSTQVEVTNWYGFVDLSHLQASWHLVQDGRVTARRPLNISVAAGETVGYPVPVNREQLDSEAWLTIEFALKDDTPWAPRGWVVAWDQLHIPGPMLGHSNSTLSQRAAYSLAGRQSSVNVTQNGNRLEVHNHASSIGFDLIRGNVTWQSNGVDLFQRGPELYFYRAMTQNDDGQSGNADEWNDAWMHSMRTQVRDVFWEDSGDALHVRFNVRVAPLVLEWGAEADIEYIIPNNQRSLVIHASGDFVGGNTPEVLPRIGLYAELNPSFNAVDWFGRGPGENYQDSKQAARFGQWGASVEELFTNYDYPQECGNREDLRWLRVGDSRSNVTMEARMNGEPFSFTAKQYTDYDLNDARHPYELNPLNKTILDLDYCTNGLGSATVGPRPFPQYRCYSGPFDFTFQLELV